jgi:uncharacterized iron-regulated membrane protein
MSIRRIAVLMHRYVGLAMAGFLVIAGLTGSIIAFNHELDEWLNPSLFERRTADAPLPPDEIIARIEAQDPKIHVSFFEFEEEPDHNAVAFVQPRKNPETGEAYEVGYSQIFADPATGEILGKRKWGAARIDIPHLIPFIYKLHYNLHLPGAYGLILMGIVGILWTIDCFVGFYLTLPQARPFWRRWAPAWKIKHPAGPHRRNLDLHRAFSLWLWAVLFIVALSGIALTLPQQVFRPVLGLFVELSPDIGDLAAERLTIEYDTPPTMDFDTTLAAAQAVAAERGIAEEPSMFWHPRDYAAIGIGFGDAHGTGLGSSWIFFDDRSGETIHVHIPGTGTPGDTFMELQFPLHSGQIVGLPGRILISISGLVVAMLSVTGVIIWARKRRSAKQARRMRATQSPSHRPETSPAE